ncbi:MAG: hypothetical protein NVSMB64_00200 [Candidatus Velthaea sp.]
MPCSPRSWQRRSRSINFVDRAATAASVRDDHTNETLATARAALGFEWDYDPYTIRFPYLLPRTKQLYKELVVWQVLHMMMIRLICVTAETKYTKVVR